MSNSITWRRRNKSVDIDTGELIPETELINFVHVKTEINDKYVINGIGTIEATKLYRRAYGNDLFGTNILPNQ